MILFWFLAGLLAACGALLILHRASRAERAGPGDDPALGVYRRQLTEIDELASRGLLGAEEQRAAHAEVGRRLLREADRAAPAPTPTPQGQTRWIVTGVAALVPVLALAAYFAVGSPGQPDQPFKQRLSGWLAKAQTDPRDLSLDEAVAILQAKAAERPGDARPYMIMALLQGDAGDPAAAARSYRKATILAPKDPEAWSGFGAALTVQAQGEVTADARQAFEQANRLDPAAPGPMYYLGRADVAAGRVQAGLERWRAAAASLPEKDPRRQAVESEIAETSRTGKLAEAPAQAQPAEATDQAAFIQAMVDRLAARLKAQPDDPAGWARLIRAYGVLGKEDLRQAAIAEVRRRFKDRPDALATALAGGQTR